MKIQTLIMTLVLIGIAGTLAIIVLIRPVYTEYKMNGITYEVPDKWQHSKSGSYNQHDFNNGRLWVKLIANKEAGLALANEVVLKIGLDSQTESALKDFGEQVDILSEQYISLGDEIHMKKTEFSYSTERDMTNSEGNTVNVSANYGGITCIIITSEGVGELTIRQDGALDKKTAAEFQKIIESVDFKIPKWIRK